MKWLYSAVSAQVAVCERLNLLVQPETIMLQIKTSRSILIVNGESVWEEYLDHCRPRRGSEPELIGESIPVDPNQNGRTTHQYDLF